MGQEKICGKQPLKNFFWSILEYFFPNKTQNEIAQLVFRGTLMLAPLLLKNCQSLNHRYW